MNEAHMYAVSLLEASDLPGGPTTAEVVEAYLVSEDSYLCGAGWDDEQMADWCRFQAQNLCICGE